MTLQVTKLKVLHLTASLRIGGGEQLILGLVKQANRTKVTPHVYAFGTFGEDSLLRDFEELDLPLRLFPSDHFYNPRIWLDLARYLKQHNIDIIHTHLCDGDILGRIIGKLLGIPVVSTLQNTPADFEQYRLDRQLLAKMTARWLNPHLVAVSERIGQEFIEDWALPPNRISSIYNAVNLNALLKIPENSARTPNKSGLVITNIARHTEQKAQHVLLKAFQLVLQQEPRCQLWLVGDGELRPQLETLAHKFGVQAQVRFWGVRRDIPDILAQTDVFVLSSLWEGLPLAAIEAMAAARPVVLTDVGGNQELVDPDIHGLLIPPDDPRRLSEALLTLYQAENTRYDLGNRARERVKHTFDIAKIAEQYEALYALLSDRYESPVHPPEISTAKEN